MVKVSIIVPVYNKEKEISKCLDSLVNQTMEDVEIIVIDDKSTDNSREIIDKYFKKYPSKIVKIYNKENKGIGFTRNCGVKIAKGEYIGFVDADDYVSTSMYDKYYSFAKENDLDIVTGFYNKFGSVNELFKNEYFPIGNLSTNPLLLLKLDYGPCNKIFRYSIISENEIFFEEKLKYEDMPFVLKTLKNSNRVGHINEAYYYYNVHLNSETTIVDKRVFDMFKIMDIVNDYYKDFRNKECLEALNILQITRYMVQQKYQENHSIANDFIDCGYDYLNRINPMWKKNVLYCKESIFKRFVKNYKFILKTYCRMFKLFK